MKRLINLIILPVFLLIQISCEKNDKYEYPLVITGEVTDIDSTGAIFHGKITSTGNPEFTKYGFAWGAENQQDMTSSIVSLGNNSETGIMKSRITYDLRPNVTYFVRAFAKNEKYTTYGFPVKFKSMGSLPPSITSFSPQKGSDGTKVSIVGDNFSSSVKNNIVNFGSITVSVDSASKNEIIVTLPDNILISGFVSISIEVADQKVISEKTFRLSGVLINNFYPEKLYGSDTLYIEGDDFSPIVENNIVKLGNNKAKVINISDNIITALVDYNEPVGLKDVSIAVNGKTSMANNSLEVLDTWSVANSNFNFSGRSFTAGFAINNKGYIGTGKEGYWGTFYRDLWNYSTNNQSWTECNSLPAEGRQHAVGFSILDKGYIGLGSNSSSIFNNELYEYNPTQNEWSRKSDYPGNPNTYLFSITIGNKAYVGLSELESNKEFWEYDPAIDSWTRKADFPIDGASVMCGFHHDNIGYIAITTSLSSSSMQELWKYDPNNNSWNYITNIPGGRRLWATSFVLNEFGYFGCGSINGDGRREVWRYNIKNNIWTRIADVPFGGIRESVSFIIDDTPFIIPVEGEYQNSTYDASLITFNPKW